jgi:hypothetical protein
VWSQLHTNLGAKQRSAVDFKKSKSLEEMDNEEEDADNVLTSNDWFYAYIFLLSHM